MATNAANFSRRVSLHGKQIPEEGIVEIHRALHIEAGRRLIFRSPVDTGRFRNNWQTGVSEAPTGEQNAPNPLARGEAKVARLQPFVLTTWVNNVPYAGRLENGWSSQAPNGLLRITAAEIQAAVSGAV